MKKLMIAFIFGSLSVAYAEPIDYSCAVEEGHQTFLISTKGNKNVIHVGIKMDEATCRISSEQDIMNIYWKLGEKVRDGVMPCQALSSWERRFFTLKEKDIERLSDHKAVVRYPDFSSYGNKFGQNLSSEIQVETYKGFNGKCQTKATILVNNVPLAVDRIHTVLGGLSLRSVIFFKNNQEVLVLK